jgi:LacI family transcriptional regulator
MAENRVDGLLLLPASGTTARDLAQVLGDSRMAHVLFARRVSGHSADYVGADNVKAGQLLADHLAEQGVGTAAFLGGPKRSSARRERERGVLKRLDKHGITVDAAMSFTSEASTVGGVAATTELLASGPLPDAIVAYSDAVASGVIAALRQQGIEPGKDVAVAGFDDIPQALLEHPALTTVATFPERIGQAAARLLMARIEEPSADPRQTILQPELRVRASTTNWLGRDTR